MSSRIPLTFAMLWLFVLIGYHALEQEIQSNDTSTDDLAEEKVVTIDESETKKVAHRHIHTEEITTQTRNKDSFFAWRDKFKITVARTTEKNAARLTSREGKSFVERFLVTIDDPPLFPVGKVRGKNVEHISEKAMVDRDTVGTTEEFLIFRPFLTTKGKPTTVIINRTVSYANQNQSYMKRKYIDKYIKPIPVRTQSTIVLGTTETLSTQRTETEQTTIETSTEQTQTTRLNKPKKVLTFSYNLTKLIAGTSEADIPIDEVFSRNDSNLKFRVLDITGEPVYSDADTHSLSNMLHMLIIYLVFKRILKYFVTMISIRIVQYNEGIHC